MFPPPTAEIAKEIWEEVYTTVANTLGFIILPLGEGAPGETKQDKLARGLRSLSDPENKDYTQARQVGPSSPKWCPRSTLASLAVTVD